TLTCTRGVGRALVHGARLGAVVGAATGDYGLWTEYLRVFSATGRHGRKGLAAKKTRRASNRAADQVRILAGRRDTRAGRRDTRAAAPAARTGAVLARLYDRAGRADDAQGLLRSDRGSGSASLRIGCTDF